MSDDVMEPTDDGGHPPDSTPDIGEKARIRDRYKRQVAYHEAGHAVIAVHVRGEAHPAALTLRLPYPELPPTEWEWYQPNPRPFETRADYADWILIALAGHAAGRALTAPEVAPHGHGDDDDLDSPTLSDPCLRDETDLYIVNRLVGAASEQISDPAILAEAPDWAETLQVLTERLVRAYWPAIEAVAATLLREGQIAGMAVRDLAEATASGTAPGEAIGQATTMQEDASDERRVRRLAELECIEREYRRILADELRRVTLTRDEVMLLLALWGPPPRVPGRPPKLASYIVGELGRMPLQRGALLTGVALIEKLDALSAAEEAAVIDALERADRRPWNLPHDLRLHKLGLGR